MNKTLKRRQIWGIRMALVSIVLSRACPALASYSAITQGVREWASEYATMKKPEAWLFDSAKKREETVVQSLQPKGILGILWEGIIMEYLVQPIWLKIGGLPLVF